MFYRNVCGNGIIGGMGWMMIIPALLMVVIIYFILKSLNNQKNYTQDALDVLNHKFANGEISEEEYLNRKRIIKSK